MSEPASDQPTLGSQFKKFCTFGLSQAQQQATAQAATHITLSNADKWFKQAGIIPKSLTTTDTSICFSKLK